MSNYFVSKIWLYCLLNWNVVSDKHNLGPDLFNYLFFNGLLDIRTSVNRPNPCFHRGCVTLVAEPIMLQHYALYCTFYCQSMLMLICDAWYNHFLWSGRQSVELRVRHSEIISGYFQSQLFCQWSTGYWSSSFTWSAWSAQSQCQ